MLPPSIEPHASGHIIEQIEYIKRILDAGYAYVSEGSVYFDVEKYSRDFHYGKLSGRNIDELLNTTRQLDGQSEKRNPVDFALWKKAAPEHLAPIQPYCKAGMRLFCRSHYDFDEVALFQDALEH